MRPRLLSLCGAVTIVWLASSAWPDAQSADVRADYERANTLRERLQDKYRAPAENVTWIEGTTKVWYRKPVQGGNEFVLVDAAAATKAPAFDHARLAKSLSSAASGNFSAMTLPFSTFTFVDNLQAIEFALTPGGGAGRGGRGGGRGGAGQGGTPGAPRWRCTLTEYVCTRLTGQTPEAAQGQGRGQGRGGRGRGGDQAAPGAAPQTRPSPDKRLEAFIQNYNIHVRPVGGRAQDARPLTWDGSEGNAYTFISLTWSPDSRMIAAFRRRPGYSRVVTYVRSSPVDQLQPTTMTQAYRKPGDVVDFDQPVLIDVEPARTIPIDGALFPNPYSNGRIAWRDDSRTFSFEYNQRGHQVYRVIEVDASSGAARAVIEETSKTFIDYRRTAAGLSDSGRVYRYDVAGGKEIIWMSERDGWSHLYLYDGVAGQVKHQITKGEWKVHHVERVDPDRRQVWFTANGMEPGQDPYFLKSYRINFDGTGLTSFTPGDGTHAVAWSPDRAYYVDTYQRVDMPPVVELRRASDQQLIMELERADLTALTATGWRPPEVFVAKGRDGKTDIWGLIIRPTNFDPTRRYPVIENIYAGPQGSFVPKTFSTQLGMQSLAELGFIVVQIDGMGTANRSKAFHEVAWKNLGDAGFPDRILWHKAVAQKYPYYDSTRVGLYGTSAGGQNAMGGVLFHPEFYKAAAASSGCHDNRMDKIWWNEQWMGWPLGPEYAASSNMEHAGKLQGALLLIAGELDTNVDPSSTMQVVNRLIQANKDFELLVIPNGGHTNGGAYGDRRRYDFFVRHLQGRTPPSWNSLPPLNIGGGDTDIGILDHDALPWVQSEDWQW